MPFYDDEQPGFFQRHRVLIGCGLVVVIVLAVFLGHRLIGQTSRARPEQGMVFINLPPPPTVPPPPPPASQLPPPTESEQKFVAQDTVDPQESKLDPVAKAAPGDTAALGTSIQGDGAADGFGLRAGGNGFGGNGTGKATSRTRNSQWGWYANQVQNTISQALQSNDNTRTGDFRVVARIWADRAGRVTRTRIAESTGSTALDNAITNQVLAGLILREPPPDGMPMPIVLRLTARHSQMSP